MMFENVAVASVAHQNGSYKKKCNLCSTSQLTMVVPAPKPNGALQWQAFCLPDLEKTFGRPKGINL